MRLGDSSKRLETATRGGHCTGRRRDGPLLSPEKFAVGRKSPIRWEPMKEILLAALSVVVWTLVNAAMNDSTCTDCTASERLAKGESQHVRSSLDCPRQVGPGSHAYLRQLTVDSTDGSMLLVSFSNASDAPIVKPNVDFFQYHKPIGKNGIFRSDVSVSVTCNNYWAACSVRVRAEFGCFVPCCYSETTMEATGSKYDIKCSDGSTRRALATEDTVGYADEESVKFVQVPMCKRGPDPSATPAPLYIPPPPSRAQDDKSLSFFHQDQLEAQRATQEVHMQHQEELLFTLGKSPIHNTELVSDRRLHGVDTVD